MTNRKKPCRRTNSTLTPQTTTLPGKTGRLPRYHQKKKTDYQGANPASWTNPRFRLRSVVHESLRFRTARHLRTRQINPPLCVPRVPLQTRRHPPNPPSPTYHQPPRPVRYPSAVSRHRRPRVGDNAACETLVGSTAVIGDPSPAVSS